MGDWRSSGKIAAPADGPVAWTSHADLAAADAALFLSDDPLDGPTPPLTGGEALDLAALAELAGRLSDRTMTRDVLPYEAIIDRMAARGAPPNVAEIALGFFKAALAGEFATVDPTLSRLIGRAPTTMNEVLANVIG